MNYIQVELEKSLLDPALGSTLTGFRFFWGMVVSGFDHRYHCLRCLVGRRVKELTPEWQTGPEGRVSVLIPDGAYLYLCGVARQRRLSLNFHMVLKPGDETISLPTHNAYVVRAYNAQRVPIPSERAAERYPHLGPEFLTCRNFQFGVAYLDDSHTSSDDTASSISSTTSSVRPAELTGSVNSKRTARS
jgi:hypothetical protein